MQRSCNPPADHRGVKIEIGERRMAIRDYSEEDDYYDQGFHKEGLVSVWVGLSADDGEPDLDVLQDLCGVGYYRLSDQEHYNFGFELVDLRQLLQPLSYSKSYIEAAVAMASALGLQKARWVTVQYDFNYDPAKVQRPIANDPVYIGSFPYTVLDSQQTQGLIESFVECRADGKEVHEGMDLLKLVQSGWEPLQITRVGWVCDGLNIGFDYPDGVLAKVLPGRRHVALIGRELIVVNSHGQQQYSLGGKQIIAGQERVGEFAWFEPALGGADKCFGVVFQSNGPAGIEQYQFDIEVDTGKIREIRRIH